MSWFTICGCLLEVEQGIYLHVELVIVSVKPISVLSGVWVYWFSMAVQLKHNTKLTVIYDYAGRGLPNNTKEHIYSLLWQCSLMEAIFWYFGIMIILISWQLLEHVDPVLNR